MIATSAWDNLYSPNYPDNYNDAADCYWIIHSVNDTEIELQIIDVNLEDGYDTVQIYDGNAENSPAIATLTGVIDYEITLFSTGVDLFIRFLSDRTVNAKGFHFRFRETFDKGVCESEPCQNGGTCTIVEDNLLCVCPSGTGGDFCEGKFPICCYYYSNISYIDLILISKNLIITNTLQSAVLVI